MLYVFGDDGKISTGNYLLRENNTEKVTHGSFGQAGNLKGHTK